MIVFGGITTPECQYDALNSSQLLYTSNVIYVFNLSSASNSWTSPFYAPTMDVPPARFSHSAQQVRLSALHMIVRV